MRFTAVLDNFNSDLWGHHIRVPKPIAEAFIEGKNRRVLCILNDQFEIHCALMPDGKQGYFININKEIRTKLKLKVGSEIHAELKKDESEYGLPMPEELAELFRQDEEGSTLFHALSPGKQRSLLYIIGKPKSSNTRLRKALVVVDYLKSTGGKLDFKALNQAFKDSNY
ncbi:MAG: YdeI/OmpD-associated family protein [Bacteroidota bacterium]